MTIPSNAFSAAHKAGWAAFLKYYRGPHPERRAGSVTAAIDAGIEAFLAAGSSVTAVNSHSTLTEENARLSIRVKEMEEENAKLARSYRCYSCKQVFEEDNGQGLASEHFGSWLNGDRPKCEDCLRGTASWGGGPHDPFYRVRKEEYERLRRDREELKRLRAQQEAQDDDNALWS